jgi:hypothetical protein
VKKGVFLLDHTALSAIRLSRLFARDFLEAYPWYAEAGNSFDEEYLGGQWDDEVIDGVKLLFPEAGKGRLGIVEVWGCPHLAAAAFRDRPGAGDGWLMSSWSANANRVLEAVGCPVRLGAAQAAVEALACGRVVRSDYPAQWYQAVRLPADGSVKSLSFACRAPDLYHVSAVVHATEGLLQIEIRRPDLVRANDREGAYDSCFGWLFDEGLQGSGGPELDADVPEGF